MQNAFGRIIFTKQIERIAGASVQGVLDHVAIRRAYRNPAHFVAFEKDTPVGGYCVEHHRAVGGHDDLQVVTQGQLLQLQHEKLLHPRVQPGFHFVDQNQCAFDLGDFLRQSQDGAFASRHVQFGVRRATFLGGKEQVLATAGQVNDL